MGTLPGVEYLLLQRLWGLRSGEIGKFFVECRQIGNSCEEYYYCCGGCQDFIVIFFYCCCCRFLVFGWTWAGCRQIELEMGL